MKDTPEAIAYAEAVRTIEQQARSLNEIRARTGVLLTGASVATSFLGARALEGEGLDLLSVVALVVFIAVVGLSLWTLAPPRKKDWNFALSARKLLEGWADVPERRHDTAAMKRVIAETIDDNHDHNEAKLDGLYARFQWAAGLLGLDIVLWALELT